VGSKKRSGRSQKRPASVPPKPSLQEAADQRRGEVVTVAWMLTAVFALAGEILAIVGLVAIRWGAPIGDGRVVRLVSQLALLVAVIAAALCLTLTPLVYRFREDPPPEAITYATLIIAAAPFLTALAQWFST
jgi:hypothetical protein